MDYSKYAEKTKQKISSYGGTCIITRKSDNTVYDPVTNKYVSTDITITGKGLLKNYSSNEINGTLILQGDVRLMCVFDSEPKVNDELEVGGIKYLVKDIATLNPDGSTVIYYNLQLRKK